MTEKSSLNWAITRIAQLRGIPLDMVRLRDALHELPWQGDVVLEPVILQRVFSVLGWPEAVILDNPDRAHLPLLALVDSKGWAVLTDVSATGGWMLDQAGNRLEVEQDYSFFQVIRIGTAPAATIPAQAAFATRLGSALRSFRSTIAEAIAASFFINVLAAMVSFFSLQVYDHVIPSRSLDTLLVLLLGVLLLIGIEWLMKLARSRVMDRAVAGIDAGLSREIFQRFLKVRLDQMPGTVGSLAAQLRGYEQVRSFYTASTLFSLVDLPAAVIFLAVIASIASPLLALVPLVMALGSLAVGMLFRRRVRKLAAAAVRESNMRVGLLVETIEGAETIKAAQGGWQFLSKWIGLCSASIRGDMRMRHTNDALSYYLAASQQISYVLLISLGALLVTQGAMTMGALIACSILGGRVLSAVMMMPSLMVQHAHAKVAMDGIESIYQLKTDNDGVSRPLTPTRLQGDYLIQNVVFAYPESPPALNVASLRIRAGERVGILGPIGSGKSTLLKVMAALYQPAEGQVLLDHLDVSHIARESMCRQVGYLQQDHRLFQGTLRENLLVGIMDPGDDVLQQALNLTGLGQFVAAHPRGLELPIYEGGKGLSGGQKQLVAFTRLLLARPKILLLDEPTASMDDALEQRCLHVLRGEMFTGSTMVVVTHKTALLSLVSRLVVVAGGRVIMDGPKEEILARLRAPQGLLRVQSHSPCVPAAAEGDTREASYGS